MNYFPEMTGIGKYTGEMAAYLAKQNFTVQVVTGLPYYPEWKVKEGYSKFTFQRECLDGVSVLRCPLYIPKKLTSFYRIIQDLSFFISSFIATLFLLLKKKKYDLIVSISPSIFTGINGIWLKYWNPDAKLVYHVQDLQIDAADQLKMIRSSFFVEAVKKVEKYILKNANAVSTISAGMLHRISAKAVPIKKKILFPNWIDDSKVFIAEPNHHILDQLGIPKNKKIIFYSGAVGEKQGLDILLSVVDYYHRTHADLLFVISGGGPYLEILKNKFTKRHLSNIYFIDLQPVNIYNELLNLAWLHIILQRENAADLVLPSKLTNIMAVGGLILATAPIHSTLYEIIKKNNLGYVVRPDRPEEIVKAINYLLQHPDYTKELKHNAHEFSNKNLKKDIILNQFINEVQTI
jgi:colanic acid biosynthesis glycosyl transferase WcaI